jgi:hypothetical protein
VALTVAIVLTFFAPWLWNLVTVRTGLAIETVELSWGLGATLAPADRSGGDDRRKPRLSRPCRPTGCATIR